MKRLAPIMLTCIFLCSPIALAQNDASDSILPPEPTEANPWAFTFGTGIENRGDGALKDGGDVASNMFHFDLRAIKKMSPDLTVDLKFAYGFEQFDFDGALGFGALAPWEDIQTIDFSANFQYQATSDWILFGGPIVKIARESGSDWEDGIMGGGFFGATHILNKNLILGAGLGAISLVEDDARVFPVIVVDWLITENLRLKTTNSATRNGLEVVYEGFPDWEFGAGFALQFRRFRLDNTGVAPGGAGEESVTPLTIRITYQPRDDYKFNLYGGFFSDGELEVDNAAGDALSIQNFDDQAYIGVSISIQF